MAQLRDLPGLDRIIQDTAIQEIAARYGLTSVKQALREIQADLRAEGTAPDWATDTSAYCAPLHQILRPVRYTPVFNLTGTIIHTNLGRALLSADLWRNIEPLVTRPMNLEYDLDAGMRGDRDAVIEQRLCRLIGCEAATIVNNCAAALMLVLNTFALNQKVAVSRGELVEIGGSFRLPELMQRAGCGLLEVGTTNRTRGSDYAQVTDEVAMLLKVHPSNYHIAGFTEDVGAAELGQIAAAASLPSCVDLGSGSLIDMTRWNLPPEPTPQSILKQGIDLVAFSGDKLLGGVQAGFIVGAKAFVDPLRKNPMKRALRLDKVALAILDATLQLYENPEHLTAKLPLLRTLTLSETALLARAETVRAALPAAFISQIVSSEAQIGSGALPDQNLASIAVTIRHEDRSATEIATALRQLPVPVVGRIKDDLVWLDMHGAEPLDELTRQLAELSKPSK